MTDVRLLVFDLDGTLLGPDHRIPDRVRSSIFSLRDAGIETTLATGRPFVSVARFIDELELHVPVIVFNGAAVVEPDGSILSLRPLPLDTALAALDLLGETAAATHAYVSPTDSHLMTDVLGPAAKHILEKDGMPAECVEDLSAFLAGRGADPIKLFSIGARDELERVQERFRSIAPEATCVFSEHDMLEFLGPGVNKGAALVSLCDAVGVDIDSVMAFGDNLNDLEMLVEAGVGVAIASAPTEMLRRADAVACDVETFLRERFADRLMMETVE